MRRASLVLALLFTVGCVYGPAGLVRPPTQPESVAVHGALTAWNLPEPIASCDSTEIVVAVARSHREMYSMTGLCGPTDGPLDQWQEDHCWYRTAEGGHVPRRVAGAYLRTYAGGLWPIALFGSRPTIVVWGGLSGDRLARLVRHEAVHWIQECSGRGQTYPSHADREVWCEAGCPGRFRGAE